jgi:hypothetical protein
MTTHVYRLDITYPEGSDDGYWEPEGDWWEHLPRWDKYQSAPEVFEWPAEHLYLSRSGADKRATMLRAWGATAKVVRSAPVEFPDD